MKYESSPLADSREVNRPAGNPSRARFDSVGSSRADRAGEPETGYARDVMIEDEYADAIEIIPVSHISKVLDAALEGEPEKDSLLQRLAKTTGSLLDPDVGGITSPSPQ